ncbi:hypothetical protein V6Z11_D04G124900 [Gossypium hirsutum]
MTKSPSSSPKLSSPFRRKEKAWFLYFNIRPLILTKVEAEPFRGRGKIGVIDE